MKSGSKIGTKDKQPTQSKKLTAKAPAKRSPVVSELIYRGKKAYIGKESLDKLRDQDDFIDLVKVMRLSNVLTYVTNLILTETNDNDPISRRAQVRNSFNAGGYVYEACCLLKDLEKRNKGKAYFSGFRKILVRFREERNALLLKLLRNNTAFHMDHSNYSTRAALKKLGHKELEVMTAKENSYLATYFPLPDDIDLNYVIDELIKYDTGDGSVRLTPEEENDLVGESFLLVAELARDLAFASQRFIGELSKRLGLLR